MIGWPEVVLHAHYFEVASDLVTTAGAVWLVVPTKRLLDRRKLLHQSRIKLRDAAKRGIETGDLQGMLPALESAVAEYEPRDRTEVLVGLALLILGLGLKLVYHALR